MTVGHGNPEKLLRVLGQWVMMDECRRVLKESYNLDLEINSVIPEAHFGDNTSDRIADAVRQIKELFGGEPQYADFRKTWQSEKGILPQRC